MESDLTEVQPEAVVPWSSSKRIAFRLAFVYFVLYALPFPVGTFPFTEGLGALYERIWHVVVPWVAHHLLHVGYEFSFEPTGSGDTTYNWVQNLIVVVLAIAGCAIWSALDRKRTNYDRLHNWLRLYVRLYLGAVIIGYGAFKVIQSQFPPPYLSRLVQPYGDSSPMGLLWTFMGSSYAYNFFTGAAEILAGVFLIVPALATLGALFTIAVMGNVFILNMSYDVPVKLFSFNLIVMAIFVLLPDVGRLLNVLVLNRETKPAPARELFALPNLNRGLLVLQLLFLVVTLGFALYTAKQSLSFFQTATVPPALSGIWLVHEYSVDGQVRPPSMSDADRWQRVIFQYSFGVGVQFMDAPSQRYNMELDQATRSIKLTSRDDPNWKANLNYELSSPSAMLLKGEVGGHPVEMKLQRKDLSSFRLLNRGFHWISEAPFNR